MRKKVLYIVPFFGLWAVGFIFNLDLAWYYKLLMFVGLFFIWKYTFKLVFLDIILPFLVTDMWQSFTEVYFAGCFLTTHS